MGRKIKEGLDYFELDCRLNQKFKLIEAEFGLKGFALLVKLWQQIYSQHGYYCEFSKDDKLLFLSELGGNSGADENLIDNVVAASIRRGIFSKDLYDKHQILTSRRIQEQYFNAVSRREIVEVENEYLLFDVGNFSNIVYRNKENVDRNKENVDRSTQRKEKKSKEKKSREEKSIYEAPDTNKNEASSSDPGLVVYLDTEEELMAALKRNELREEMGLPPISYKLKED